MGLFDSLLGSKKMTREKVMQMAQGHFADFSKADSLDRLRCYL